MTFCARRRARFAIRSSRQQAVGYRFKAKKDQSACSSIEVAEDHVVGTPEYDENFIRDKPGDRCEKASFGKLARKCNMNS